MDIINKMKQMIIDLNHYTYYYDQGTPIISDKEWDKLYFELQELEKKTNITFPNSPTQSISYNIVTYLKKVEHSHLMLSLGKTKSIEDIKVFLKEKPAVCMAKIDGLSCSIRYDRGQLVSAETRGNGKVGELVTHNIKTILNIPQTIPYTGEFVVDGEIICKINTFNELNATGEYKNPRNYAAGSIRLLDSNICKERQLSFIAWDIISDICTSMERNLRLLDSYGFEVVPYTILSHSDSIAEIQSAINQISTSASNNNLPIDGIVFRFDSLKYGKEQGRTEHHFKHSIAYKFSDEEVESKIVDIEWSIGRTGVLTPIAVFEPIEIDGTIVEKASLHNISIMQELIKGTPCKGDVVTVIKANQIIPQIIKWEVREETNDPILSVPEICPACGKPTKIRNSATAQVLYCENSKCMGQSLNLLKHFCSKKGLDIKGLSTATLSKLIDSGLVKDAIDIFNLYKHKEEILRLPRLGEKTVEKLLQSIETVRDNVDVISLISAIGIPLMARASIESIFEQTGIKSYQEFRDLIKNNFDFGSLNGFSYEKSNAILNYNYSFVDKMVKKCFDNIAEIKESMVEIKPTTNKIENLIFVITGKLISYKNRKEIENVIILNGGIVSKNVTSNTNFLICNDKNLTTIKTKKAKDLGIKIISEQEFNEMISVKEENVD